MQLIGSQTSPYVRKFRILFFENNTPFDFKDLNIYEKKEDAELLRKISPINKIPILIDGKNAIFESRIIYKYLSNKLNWKELTLQEENLLSIIDSGIDACVILLLSKRSGLNIDGNHMIFKRNKYRTQEVLTFLDNVLKENPSSIVWNYTGVSLYCFLDWALHRKLIDLSTFPNLNEYLNKNRVKESVIKSQIPS